MEAVVVEGSHTFICHLSKGRRPFGGNYLKISFSFAPHQVLDWNINLRKSLRNPVTPPGIEWIKESGTAVE